MKNVFTLPLDETNTGIGPAPDDLSEDVAQAWNDIVAAVPPGVLMPLHQVFIFIVASSLARWREQKTLLCETDFYDTQHVLKKSLRECLISPRDAERLLN